MPDEKGNPTLPDVLQALGAKTSDMMKLSSTDRDDLKRYLREEWDAEGKHPVAK